LFCRSKLTECSGFSLIEVVLVVLIMSILASVAARKYTGVMEQTRMDTTSEEMARISEAIVGNPALTSGGVRSDFGYVGDVGALPPDLDALVNRPEGFATWNGPYLQSDFEEHAKGYKQDSWGAEYAYSGGVVLSSIGSGSTITKQFATSPAVLTSNVVQGVVTDGLNNPPGASASYVGITIRYPDGAGSLTEQSVTPASGGNFSFGSVIPVGNHEITALYEIDTVVRYVSVLPGSAAIVNFRLPGDLWTPSRDAANNVAGTGLRYVSGSATAINGDKDLTFDIVNSTDSDIDIPR
jgi:general secretion pathway protein G